MCLSFYLYFSSSAWEADSNPKGAVGRYINSTSSWELCDGADAGFWQASLTRPTHGGSCEGDTSHGVLTIIRLLERQNYVHFHT